MSSSLQRDPASKSLSSRYGHALSFQYQRSCCSHSSSSHFGHSSPSPSHCYRSLNCHVHSSPSSSHHDHSSPSFSHHGRSFPLPSHGGHCSSYHCGHSSHQCSCSSPSSRHRSHSSPSSSSSGSLPFLIKSLWSLLLLTQTPRSFLTFIQSLWSLLSLVKSPWSFQHCYRHSTAHLLIALLPLDIVILSLDYSVSHHQFIIGRTVYHLVHVFTIHHLIAVPLLSGLNSHHRRSSSYPKYQTSLPHIFMLAAHNGSLSLLIPPLKAVTQKPPQKKSCG